MCTIKNVIFSVLAFMIASSAYSLTSQEVYQKVSPSIHLLFGVSKNKVINFGSAVAVTKNILVSNCHVVLNGEKFFLKEKGKVHLGLLFHQDKANDLCVFAIPDGNFSPAKIRKIATLKLGEEVYAIGNPNGAYRRISRGVLSYIHQSEDKVFIETDVSTNHGSSGGGLFDSDGNLVGITTRAGIQLGDSTIAMPAELVFQALPSLEKKIEYTKNVKSTEKYDIPPLKQKAKNENPVSREVLGVYGQGKIKVVKIAKKCFIQFSGYNRKNQKVATALFSPSFPTRIYVYPKASNLSQTVDQIVRYKRNPYKMSGSFINLVSKQFELSGNYDNRGDFYIQWADFNSPLTNLLSRGKYFLVAQKHDLGFHMITFSLLGFSESLSNYTNQCQQSD